MIKVENLVTPNTAWWDVAIKGIRNSYKSNDKHDSCYCYGSFAFPDNKSDLCEKCPFYKINCYEDECTYYENEGYPTYVLGENDLKLFLNLCKAGTSHRKVLRQLPVIMDITAPLYFWKQLDQYKLGTVTNAESTMHTLIKKDFEEADFSFDYFNSIRYSMRWGDGNPNIYLIQTIQLLNQLREIYLEEDDKEIREIMWNQINELLPQSYNQKRTWSANYEVLLNIVQQRKNHMLSEWNDFIDILLEHVPYLKEIVEAMNE